MIIVEELAAKLQIKLAAELINSFIYILRLRFKILAVAKT